MKLAIENLSQLDSRWAKTTLGTSGTIKDYGCALICVTMTCNYYGHKVTPLEVNELLKQNGGYINGNLMNWAAVSKFYPDIIFDKKIECKSVPAPLDVVDNYLNAGKPVIAFVDYNPATPDPEQHFVLIVGKDEQGEYIINDPMSNPGDGSYYLSAKYGPPAKAICGLRLYSGPVPVVEDNKYWVYYKGAKLTPPYEKNPADVIFTLENSIKNLDSQLSAKTTEVELLRREIDTQDAYEKQLITERDTARKERDDISVSNDKKIAEMTKAWQDERTGLEGALQTATVKATEWEKIATELKKQGKFTTVIKLPGGYYLVKK